jgi:hypothetical protein
MLVLHLDYLTFDLSEDSDGVTIMETMASTPSSRHASVMNEVRQVLNWAWAHFPRSHGPVGEGMDWDDDLQVSVEHDDWHTVALTLAGSPRFVEELLEAFGGAID